VTADDDPLRRTIEALERAGIPAMLTGSLASAFYGEPRATRDMDLVIETDAQRLRSFVRSLSPSEFYVDEDAAIEALETEGQFNVIDTTGQWKIDLIIRKSRPFSLAEFARRRRERIGDLEVDIVSPEDLVIAKLEWAKRGGSQRQIEDAAGVVGIAGSNLDRAYLDRWIRELELAAQWADLESRLPRSD
jgi:hypothetical protein